MKQVPSYQAAMYMHPQQMYPGGQAGVVVIQPDGAMAPIPHGYMVAGQQGAFMPPQVLNTRKVRTFLHVYRTSASCATWEWSHRILNLHNPALVKIDSFLWGLSLLSTSLYE